MQTEALERHARLSRTAQSRRFSPSALADCRRMLVWLFGARYAALSTVFVSSPYVRSQAALANYNMREYSPPPDSAVPTVPVQYASSPPARYHEHEGVSSAYSGTRAAQHASMMVPDAHRARAPAAALHRLVLRSTHRVLTGY
jgi:hypothetical protein